MKCGLSAEVRLGRVSVMRKVKSCHVRSRKCRWVRLSDVLQNKDF